MVATGGNQRQIDWVPNPQKQAKSVATGCHQLRETFHGKQGVCRGLPPVVGGPLPAKEGVDLSCFGARYFLLLQSGHGHWSQPQPVHALRIMARFYSAAGRLARDRPMPLANVAAGVAVAAFATLPDRDGGNEQRRGWVHPPEPKQRIRAKTDQECDRKVRA